MMDIQICTSESGRAGSLPSPGWLSESGQVQHRASMADHIVVESVGPPPATEIARNRLDVFETTFNRALRHETCSSLARSSNGKAPRSDRISYDVANTQCTNVSLMRP